ncbi:hypothetical protein KYK30_20605 [Shinella yambaruensis]|uniref:Uncharacterized protein n=1 Tax=Shinella yambaruensis TaxID=415996 RepID=A0ABQ5ZER3_9HYPH|nr:hypothetical protein [Shinella yambaruensis]MCJ8027003.1 hypothetical protein [Shinella yambaruensis]MCU7982105.1 hypothetical protein [Shinella yambaruensis]GLR51280.1 hypothetical protein GCM10007923_24880 [Shinella yambaruensis]
MRIAIASVDTIDNVIEAPSLAVAATLFPHAELIDVATTAVGIGWVRTEGGWAPPAVPEPVPVAMTHLQFIEHAQVAGDLSDEGLVAARADPLLAAFWIKFELATSLERDHPTTVQGLAALVATGHLTEEGREAIVELWPTV